MIRRLAVLAAALLAFPVGAAAQTVTSADIERLQDGVFQAGTEVSQLRSRDAARARQLQVELDELRDVVIYLKVKLRKEGRLERLEYSDVRDRIERLRFGSLVGPSPAVVAPPPVAARPANELPAETEFEVRLINSLNSWTGHGRGPLRSLDAGRRVRWREGVEPSQGDRARHRHRGRARDAHEPAGEDDREF